MLQKIKVIHEGGHKLNSKYDKDQLRVLICRRIWIPYSIELCFKVAVAYIRINPRSQNSTTLKRKPVFQIFLFNLCQITPNQTTYLLLASIGNFDKGGAWLPRYLDRLEVNMFNGLLSLHILGLKVTKPI